MTGNVIQTIFQQNFSKALLEQRFPLHMHKAAQSIMRCRTGFYGSHLESCEQGCTQKIRYHSCHHRSCPQCNTLPRERWLEQQHDRLLACEHYHIVFTVPQDLRKFWQFNSPLFIDDLFHAANEALMSLCKNPLYLGGTPGVLMAFHSWSRRLDDHPHIHCLVSAEALSDSGQWVTPKRDIFLPARLLMAAFRTLLLKRLIRRARRDEWSTDIGSSNDLEILLKQQYQQRWHVQVQPRYRHGRGVVSYLARYMRGGPCHHKQLQLIGNQVLLHPKKGDSAVADRHFTKTQFIARYLAHVPQHRLRSIRKYGLYAGSRIPVQERNAARPTDERVSPLVKTYTPPVHSCATCGTPVIRMEPVQTQGQDPPILLCA
jgi:hypothetical protein